MKTKSENEKYIITDNQKNLISIGLSILALVVSMIALNQASKANNIAQDANQLTYAENSPIFELVSDFEKTGIVNIINTRGIMSEAKLSVEARILCFSIHGNKNGFKIKNDNYLSIDIDDFFVDANGEELREAFWQPYDSEKGFYIKINMEQYSSCLQIIDDIQNNGGKKYIENEESILTEENHTLLAFNIPIMFTITYKDLLGLYCTETYGITDNVLTKVDRYDMLNQYVAFNNDSIHIGDYCSYKLFVDGRLDEDPNYKMLVAEVDKKISEYMEQ